MRQAITAKQYLMVESIGGVGEIWVKQGIQREDGTFSGICNQNPLDPSIRLAYAGS